MSTKFPLYHDSQARTTNATSLDLSIAYIQTHKRKHSTSEQTSGEAEYHDGAGQLHVVRFHQRRTQHHGQTRQVSVTERKESHKKDRPCVADEHSG